MSEFTEVKSAAELNAAKPPPFVASQSGAAPAPTINEEAQLRALFQQAAASGSDDLNTVVNLPTLAAPSVTEQPLVPVIAPSIPAATPEKFLTPQGTVDEEKLKASSKQLDQAIEQKQKTVEEILADYKDREKKLHELSQQASTLRKEAPPAPMISAATPPADPQMAQLHQQILQDMQRDPVGASIMLTEALLAKKLEPLMERFRQDEEVRRDGAMRDSLAKLAQEDPRILNPQLFAVVNQILDEDPAMLRLKNPHKAAWNEAKTRLRLGEAIAPPAQPSSSSPTLGRGAPPSVSTLPGPQSPQSMYQQATNLQPYSDDGKRFEEQLKEATRTLWQ